MTFSTGRDIVLEPRQAGEPLNYFLNPHAEADGQPVKTEKTWNYRDHEMIMNRQKGRAAETGYCSGMLISNLKKS